MALFVGHLINTNKKSTTIRAYISVLSDVDIELNKSKSLISSLTWACKIHNDTITPCFPICAGLLKVILNKVRDFFSEQPYLSVLYRAVLIMGYFGMFRVGELELAPTASE